MTIRIEVQPDCGIEIMRPRGKRSQFLNYPTLESAFIVIKFLLKRELERVRGERFVPAIEKETRREFQKLKEKSPYAKT
jgi:hypothetical protein